MSAKNPAVLYSNHKKTINLILRCIIVFIIPIIVGLIIFKRKEIYPFGENDVLSVDLWGQYFPMYRQFAESNSFSDSMYSWNGALGFNNFVQSAFYCRSIFLLIFKFIPVNSSIIFINNVCLLRLGLSAVTCQLLLEYKFKNTSPVVMAASIGYGLCAYSIAFIMQFMWTDCILFAPLILLGLERLIEGKSPLIYIIFLTLTVYTNFYVGFGVCLFTAFYFISEMFKKAEFDFSKGFKKCFSNGRYIGNNIIKFSLYSALSGIMTAFVLVPTLIGLSNSMSANEGTLDFKQWYHTFADNISSLLPETRVSLEYGVANICVGLFIFILIPLFFFNTSIKFREKLASGAFLAILYSGLNYNPMDYVFNGFHFPNQLPGRWSFLFSLALVIVAINGISRTDGIKPKTLFTSWITGIFFILFGRYSSSSDSKTDKFNSWIILITAFAALISMYLIFSKLYQKAKAENSEENKSDKNSVIKKRTYGIFSAVSCIALAGIMTFEICSDSLKVAVDIEGGFACSNMTHYLNATNLFTDYGKKYDCGSEDLYRVETNSGWSFNDGQLGNFKGITYYGSTLNGKTFELLRFLGNRVYAQNVSSLYNNSSIVQNSIFGIKYIIDRAKDLKSTLPNINIVEEAEKCSIWENPTALPIAFGASRNIVNLEVSDEIHPITSQNNIVNLLYGEDINVFEKLSPAEFEAQNVTINDNTDWRKSSYQRNDDSANVDFRYKYICPNDAPVYIEHNFRAGNLTVNINGNERNINTGGAENFKCLGEYPAGTEINITLHAENVNSGCFGLDIYSFNMEKWQNVYNRLSLSGLDVTSFKNTRVEGNINIAQSGVVFTSIPQDGGWKVYVDGVKTDNFTIGGSLIGFNLSEGNHQIIFKYHVPGFAAGTAISVLALILTVFCLWFRKKAGNKK